MADQIVGKALAEAPELFDQAIRAAAEFHGMLPELVRKDYWVTRVLRAVAGDPALEGQVLFKGGTSLSKGWKLIDRFSEDVDLLLTGPGLGEPPGTNKARKEVFAALRKCIERETPLRLPAKPDEWFEKMRAYKYEIRYPLPGKEGERGAANTDWLFVESGFRGGANPHERRELGSLVAEFIAAREPLEALAPYESDLAPFPMHLLRPERTFAEKLFAVHSEMLKGLEGAERIGIRHYYDLAQLFVRSEDVKRALGAHEIELLVKEAARISNAYFGGNFDLDNLGLEQSPALRPNDELLRVLRRKYESRGEESLYYRSRPTFDEIIARMDDIQRALQRHP